MMKAYCEKLLYLVFVTYIALISLSLGESVISSMEWETGLQETLLVLRIGEILNNIFTEVGLFLF